MSTIEQDEYERRQLDRKRSNAIAERHKADREWEYNQGVWAGVYFVLVPIASLACLFYCHPRQLPSYWLASMVVLVLIWCRWNR